MKNLRYFRDNLDYRQFLLFVTFNPYIRCVPLKQLLLHPENHLLNNEKFTSNIGNSWVSSTEEK